LCAAAGAQGKLQGRLLEFAMPQPVDECLALMGDAMCSANGGERASAVLGVYARAVSDGDVRSLPPPVLGSVGGYRVFGV
jgi:hypothetical protein